MYRASLAGLIISHMGCVYCEIMYNIWLFVKLHHSTLNGYREKLHSRVSKVGSSITFNLIMDEVTEKYYC